MSEELKAALNVLAAVMVKETMEYIELTGDTHAAVDDACNGWKTELFKTIDKKFDEVRASA